MNQKLSFFIAFLLLSSAAFSQESKKTVILYNVIPLTVDLLPDGTIKQVYGKAEHLFQGYQLVRPDRYFGDDNAQYSDVGSDRVVTTEVRYLSFDNDVATLNKETIAHLETIKNALFTDPDKRVMLTSYSIQGNNKRDVVLLQNRLASCLSYLDVMGVSKSQVILDTNTQTNDLSSIVATEIIISPVVRRQR